MPFVIYFLIVRIFLISFLDWTGCVKIGIPTIVIPLFWSWVAGLLMSSYFLFLSNGVHGYAVFHKIKNQCVSSDLSIVQKQSRKTTCLKYMVSE